MPTFGQEIKRLREATGLDQKTLCAKADNLDYSILSRIESGITKAPKEETVRRLARALRASGAHEASEEHLLALAAGLRQRDRTTVRLGVAHCIWAAPVCLMAMRGHLTGVSITSYGLRAGDDRPGLADPFWYDSQTAAGQRRMKAGPSFVRCGAPQVRGIEEWPDGESLHTFTANDLVALLTIDPPNLDGLIAVQEAVESYRKKTRRCARLLRTVGGCSLLLGVNREVLEAINGRSSRGSTGDFQELWDRVTKESIPEVPTLCAPGTIAERHLALLHDGHDSDKPAFVLEQYIDLGAWEDVVAMVKQVLSVGKSGGADGRGSTAGKAIDGVRASGVVAFIGWEPQLSWLEKELESMRAVSFRTNQFGRFARGGELPSLSFDILFLEEALGGSPPGVGTRPFLDRLDAAVKEVQSASRRGGPSSSTVQFIARYLNMDPEKCFKALDELDFELMYYPEWVDYIQGQG